MLEELALAFSPVSGFHGNLRLGMRGIRVDLLQAGACVPWRWPSGVRSRGALGGSVRAV